MVTGAGVCTGMAVGPPVGASVGPDVGPMVGAEVASCGCPVGETCSTGDGVTDMVVGPPVGVEVGPNVGEAKDTGEIVGLAKSDQQMHWLLLAPQFVASPSQQNLVSGLPFTFDAHSPGHRVQFSPGSQIPLLLQIGLEGEDVGDSDCVTDGEEVGASVGGGDGASEVVGTGIGSVGVTTNKPSLIPLITTFPEGK